MELSEWKQRLAARKEVSGPAARSISSPSWPSSWDAMEGCSPQAASPCDAGHGTWQCRFSPPDAGRGTGELAAGAAARRAARHPQQQQDHPLLPPLLLTLRRRLLGSERQAAAWGPVPWLFWETGLKDLKGNGRSSCPGDAAPRGRAAGQDAVRISGVAGVGVFKPTLAVLERLG